MASELDVSYVKGVRTLEPLPDFGSVKDILAHFAVLKENEDAVVLCSTNQPRIAVTWKELYEKSCKMARAFINPGVKPGECIAVVTRTRPEWLYVTFGAMLAGVCVTSVVFTYTDGRDVVDLMERIGKVTLIILDPGLDETNWNILKNLLDEHKADGSASSQKIPTLRYLIFFQIPQNEKGSTVEQLLEKDQGMAPLPEVHPDNVAVLFQTSGSTGIPKLVAHTYASILATRHTIRTKNFMENDVYFNDRPFSWSGGFPVGLLFGQKRVTVSGLCPDPDNKASFIIDVITRERCTVALSFPQVIGDLNRRYEELPSDWPLKTILTGGQPVTKASASCVGRICQRIMVLYASTEFLYGTAHRVDDVNKAVNYAVGVPLPCVEMKVVDEKGKVVPHGERGEICVRTPSLFKEYVNDRVKTDLAKSSDGWYRMDDYGRISEDGYVFVEGRISDMILSGGMNVNPAILETTLKSFPGVKNAIAVPVPDDAMYQVVCACVCIEIGSDVTEVKLREFMERIHNDKQKLFTVLPKYYIILEKFPEEPNGKVSRKTLKRMALEKFSG